jgi:hypothetical protein
MNQRAILETLRLLIHAVDPPKGAAPDREALHTKLAEIEDELKGGSHESATKEAEPKPAKESMQDHLERTADRPTQRRG